MCAKISKRLICGSPLHNRISPWPHAAASLWLPKIELPPGVHVYSPPAKCYNPIQLALHPFSGIELSAAIYPNSKVLYLEAIQERIPVFEGTFRITQDVTVTPSKTGVVVRSLVSAEKTISITGELKYQA